jgi:hypothetical protein
MKESPQDVFMNRVLDGVRAAVVAAIEEYDASMRREAVARYKENRKKNRVENSKPYGHPNYPAETHGLNMILRMRREKSTVRDIVKALDEAGFKARRGRWNPGSVLRILKREGLK